MAIIRSAIDTGSVEFQARYAQNTALVEDFRRRQDTSRGERAKRDVDHVRNQGKMLPRERLELLLDPGTPFLEFSSLAANMAYDLGDSHI